MKFRNWAFILASVGIGIFFIIKILHTSQCVLTDKVAENRYYWMFQSNIAHNLKNENASANIKKSKYHFSYNYQDLYRYIIIEDGKLDNISLKEIKTLTTDVNKNKRSIESSEGFEIWTGKHMTLKSNLCTDSTQKLTIDFDPNAIITQKNTVNGIGYEGKFESVLFKNENGAVQYSISFDSLTTNKIIFYKPKGKLYIIFMTPFAEHIEIQKGIANLKLY